jgi:hypothetical protein
MPFHSVKTEAEAENLVVMYCTLRRGSYRIRVDWRDQDIMSAVQSAIYQFQLGRS